MWSLNEKNYLVVSFLLKPSWLTMRGFFYFVLKMLGFLFSNNCIFKYNDIKIFE
ncbi:hypothetical protein FD15_GL000023 [Liquorilactobacillus sucicola DSM 21376 = JCM 15457]|uniref:Uncharacterized protein n=1 Tax=Liquorilactobacillus sucicola DSM 21376 = JCM 15457 TaxID=1423806 RepID=A0A0R2DTA6_9LACO|nr:hypothetical protein FD15_GL000023 [Liquorilactobacillus sucicola DSM 21376 = JCM 15457]